MNSHLYAEQALLGALLLDPAQADHVAAWLASGDFAHADHGLLFQAITDLDLEAMLPELSLAQGDERLRLLTRHVITALGAAQDAAAREAYAYALMAATRHPQNAAWYGRMVLEASVQRLVGQAAARIAGQQPDTDEDPEDALAAEEAALARAIVVALAAEWRLASEAPEAVDAAAHLASWLSELTWPLAGDALAGGDVLGSAISGAPGGNDEDQVLAAVVNDPAGLEELGRWLLPEDFTDADRAELYSAALEVHGRGDPVDAVAVLWEGQHRDLWSATFTPDDAMQILRAPVPAAGAAAPGRRVLVGAIRRTVTRETMALEEAAWGAHDQPEQVAAGAGRQWDQPADAAAYDELAGWPDDATPPHPGFEEPYAPDPPLPLNGTPPWSYPP